MDYAEDLFDLSILYTQDAIQWCEYLFDIFKDFNIQQNSEDVLDIIDNPSSLENIKNSIMNVVIISPLFLLKCNPKVQDHLHHVVGLLCGVEDSDMNELFEMIPSSKNWTQVDATAGGTEITHVVLKVLSDAGKERVPSVTEDTYLTMVGSVNQEVQGDYMDMRVKTEPDGPPENTYFMRGPAPEEDYETMKPLAPPTGHVFKPVKEYINMKGVKNMSQCSPGMTIQPEAAGSGEGGVLFVIFQDDVISMNKQDQYVVNFNGKLRKNEVPATQKNPYTLEIQLPKDHPAEIVDGQVVSPSRGLMGTFKFHFRSAMDDLTLALLNVTDPMKFMCQALGISPADSNELDNMLFEYIQQRLPQGGLNLLVGQEGAEQSAILEVPTALHFAAMHGLKSMCSMLTTCPGALQAMKTKNRNGLTPDTLAAKNGHSDLSSLLENFVYSAEDEGIQPDGSAPTSSYLFMKSGFGTYYKNEDFLQQLRKQTPNYDLPFKVPIPARGIAEDETIKELMKGKREDIEDFYDSLTLDFGSFERDPDPEEDYEEVLDEGGNIRRSTIKKTISRRPPIKHPSEEKAEIPGATTPVEPKAPPLMDTNVQEASLTKKDKSVLNLPGIGAEQQALIDLQNSVKSNDITLDEAVLLFKNYNLLHENKTTPFLTQPPKAQRKDTKSGGLRNFLTKKQTKKVPMTPTATKVQERSTVEVTTRTNRPTSTTSSASSDSRGSVLSISDRDSSYSSTIEEVEQDKNQPVLKRQEKINEKPTSQQDRIKRLSSIPDFSQDYIEKPVPPIPRRSPQQIPKSLQDLPKPVPPVPSPDYSQFKAPQQQAEYLEFDGPPDDKAPEDLPALPRSLFTKWHQDCCTHRLRGL